MLIEDFYPFWIYQKQFLSIQFSCDAFLCTFSVHITNKRRTFCRRRTWFLVEVLTVRLFSFNKLQTRYSVYLLLMCLTIVKSSQIYLLISVLLKNCICDLFLRSIWNLYSSMQNNWGICQILLKQGCFLAFGVPFSRSKSEIHCRLCSQYINFINMQGHVTLNQPILMKLEHRKL